MKDTIRIKLWGVRGSIPCPGADTVIYGGNTISIELRFGEKNRLIIIDAGSGIRNLGYYMLKNDLPNGPINTELFFTHTHWDHLMGFPFFVPIYIPGTKIKIYGPVTFEEESLESIIGGQLQYRYFPIRQNELSAEFEYCPLMECTKDLGDGIILKTKYLNHPILCLGYRFEFNNKVFCTGYDTEPFLNVFETDPESPDYDQFAAEEGEKAVKEENEKTISFFKGADLLIHDAQYTKKEYNESKKGWGHSTFDHAIKTGHKAHVKKLVLFHHDMMRKDSELESLEKKYKKLIQGKTSMELVFAKELMEFEI